MTETDLPPDRLSSNPRSPHYDEAALSRGIGIRFKGAQRHDVEEYSRSEGWIRVALGKKVDRHGQPLTLKLSGEVEAWFERPAEGAETDADRKITVMPGLSRHPPCRVSCARVSLAGVDPGTSPG